MVRIRSDDGNTADVLVNGGSFGRILSANDHYRRAIDENSPTTVSSICYGDASANEMTAELWKAGNNTDAYAFKPATYSWSIGDETRVDASTLSAVAHSPAEEALLDDPITHYTPPTGKVSAGAQAPPGGE